ncbi:hypothetical protein JCM10908_005296 [Rhodotorula pacifica]|uniref:C2H2-type zinc finger protein n=1 Tax=Rhodotorula pacifica TaxID=1495444 RepID=UPI003177299B
MQPQPASCATLGVMTTLGSPAFRRPDGLPEVGYAFPPTARAATQLVSERRHSRSHTTPAMQTDSSALGPIATQQLHPQSFGPVEPYSPHNPSYTRPEFSYEGRSYADPAQQAEAHQYGVERSARMRRSISHNPPVFPSFPHLSSSSYPAGPALSVHPTHCEPHAASQSGFDIVATSTSSTTEVAGAASMLHARTGYLLAQPTVMSYSAGQHPYVTPIPATASAASSSGIPLVLTAGTVSPAWAHISHPTGVSHSGVYASSDPDPPRLDGAATSPSVSSMQRTESSDSACTAATTATTTTTASAGTPECYPSQSSPRADEYRFPYQQDEADQANLPLGAQPSSSFAAPAHSARPETSDGHHQTCSSVSPPAVQPPRQSKRRQVNSSIQLPPPQALLAPGVVAPSAGAIAAPNGRGTAIFPGTNSPALPTDEDYEKMVTKSSRGRRAVVMSQLKIDPEVANDPSATPTLEQLQFAGFTKTGKPKKVYVCKAPECGRVFRRSEHLKRHVRSIHTYEKPFQCQWPTCKKYFARHDNLKQHLRTHRRPGQTDDEFSALLQQYFAKRHEEAKKEQAQWQQQQRYPLASSPAPVSATPKKVQQQQQGRKRQREEAVIVRRPPAALSFPPPQSLRHPPPGWSSAESHEQPQQQAGYVREGVHQHPQEEEEGDYADDDEENAELQDEDDLLSPNHPIALAWEAATGQPLYPRDDHTSSKGTQSPLQELSARGAEREAEVANDAEAGDEAQAQVACTA